MSSFRKNFPKYFLFSLGVVAGLVWAAVFQLEQRLGLLHVYFFDVGQGDAILIEAPNGNQVLIDGGPDGTVLSKLGSVMPFWDRSIDLLILTHPHADHLDGLVEVLKRYHADAAFETGVNHSIPEHDEWRELLRAKKVKIITARAGQRIYISRDIYFDILTPLDNFVGESLKDIHDAVIIAKLTYGDITFLLTGDAEKHLEYKFVGSSADIDVDILKVGHHGSKTSTAEEFLQVTSPELAVVSAGRKNRYGHPHQEVLDRLNAFGAKIFRTDRDGDITVLSNGQGYRVIPALR